MMFAAAQRQKFRPTKIERQAENLLWSGIVARRPGHP
jgi:hypothetical protein